MPFADDHAIGPTKEPVKKISGVEFHGARISDGGLGHQFGGTYYHGFLGGVCYELGYGIATAGYGAVDGMKQVDSAKIFSILENILETVTIRIPVLGPAQSANGSSRKGDHLLASLADIRKQSDRRGLR